MPLLGIDCSQFKSKYLEKANCTISETCKIVMKILNRLKEMHEPSYLDEDTKYLYYSLYVEQSEKKCLMKMR